VGQRDLVLYGGGDGRCYAFAALSAPPEAPDLLDEIWNFDANPARYRAASPTTDDYWDIALGGRRGQFPDGDVVSCSEIISTPVLYQGRVYVAIGQDPMHGPGRGALSCYDATGTGDITETGRIWQYTDIGRTMATVSIADGLVYVAETAGKVHCLDASTGKLIWAVKLDDDAWASTLVADGKIYIGTRRGLTVLKAGRRPQHLADMRLGTRVPSAPVAANGVLFVASNRELWAIQEKGEMP
jgi:outer membrane protein assembly factor BamB